MSDTERSTLLDTLLGYVRNELVADPDLAEITPTTPLLAWGILDSIRTARLLAHLRDELGVLVPAAQLTGAHFKDVESITDLVLSLRQPS
ncbi:acyl carrier protein [Streptomyces sp. NPDC000941]